MTNKKNETLTKYYKEQGLTERQINNRLKKEEAKETEQKTQKAVKEIKITIEWKKSKTWGNCPRAEADIYYKESGYEYKGGFYASGCGYDKESTVIAQIFNEFLKYKLWEIEGDIEKQKEKPYGITLNYDFSPYYDGGVGTSCYYRIAEYIGGKLEHTATGKTFDVYRIILN